MFPSLLIYLTFFIFVCCVFINQMISRRSIGREGKEQTVSGRDGGDVARHPKHVERNTNIRPSSLLNNIPMFRCLRKKIKISPQHSFR